MMKGTTCTKFPSKELCVGHTFLLDHKMYVLCNPSFQRVTLKNVVMCALNRAKIMVCNLVYVKNQYRMYIIFTPSGVILFFNIVI